VAEFSQAHGQGLRVRLAAVPAAAQRAVEALVIAKEGRLARLDTSLTNEYGVQNCEPDLEFVRLCDRSHSEERRDVSTKVAPTVPFSIERVYGSNFPALVNWFI
jgi:hypothetical protein